MFLFIATSKAGCKCCKKAWRCALLELPHTTPQGLDKHFEAGAVVQSLINSRPEATTALLMQLCTEMGDAAKADSDWVAKIGDFAHLYTSR